MSKPLAAPSARALLIAAYILAHAVAGVALWQGRFTPVCVHEDDVIDSVTPTTWPRCPTE